MQHQVHPNRVGAWMRQGTEGLVEVLSMRVEGQPRHHESRSAFFVPRSKSQPCNGILIVRVGYMCRSERRAMIVGDRSAMSLTRQRHLELIGRCSLDYKVKRESAKTLAPMRWIDEGCTDLGGWQG